MVLKITGKVQDADHFPGQRIMNGHSGTGEIVELLAIVLRMKDMAGLPGSYGHTHGVGADKPFIPVGSHSEVHLL